MVGTKPMERPCSLALAASRSIVAMDVTCRIRYYSEPVQYCKPRMPCNLLDFTGFLDIIQSSTGAVQNGIQEGDRCVVL